MSVESLRPGSSMTFFLCPHLEEGKRVLWGLFCKDTNHLVTS